MGNTVYTISRYSWFNTNTSFIISDKMKEEIWWTWSITTYEEFIEKVSARSPKRKWEFDNRYKSCIEFIEKINTDINKNEKSNNDPIQYLIYLYSKYWEWLPINDIYEKLWHFWENKNNKNKDESFRKFFVITLWWKLRDTNDRTAHSIEKNKSIRKKLNTIGKHNIVKIEDSINKFKNKFKEILDWIEKNKNITFDINIFKKLQNNQNKIIYILSYLLKINYWEVINKIKILKDSWILLSVIAKQLEEFVNNNWEDIPKIKISRDNIRHITERNLNLKELPN